MSGPSSDQLAELVHSLVPSTRRRRGESDAAVRERRALRADLLDLVHDIFHSELSSSPAAEEHEITDAIRRKLTRYAVDGGHGTGVRFETLLSKLKSQPSRPRNLNAVLELLQHLSFSAQAGDTAESSSAPRRSAAPAPAAFALDVPSMVPAARSSAPAPPPALEPESRPVTRSDAGVPARAPVRPARVEEADVSTGLPIAKAEVVRRWRERKGESNMDRNAHQRQLRPYTGRAEVPETELLRDVIYLLQGINGKHVGFEVVQKLPSTEVGVDQSAERLLRVRFEEGERVISPSTRHLVHRIAELGRLYRRISEFAQQQQTEETGLIKQVRREVVAARLGPALTPAAEFVPLYLLGTDGLLPPHCGAGGASQPHAAGGRRQREAS
jgi:gamma-tubulin complex component 3